MAGNSFGQIFRLTTFGESHGIAIGGIIDGCPAGLELDMEAIQAELDRRKPGQSKLSSQRKESDQVEFLSGIFEGVTTGTPIGFILNNEDARSKDYSHIKDSFRPSHADFTYEEKYGVRDYRGGGRSSARETACRVVAGSIAAQFIAQYGIECTAFVSAVGELELQTVPASPKKEEINKHISRAPDSASDQSFAEHIDQIRLSGDTVGGVVSAVVKGMPTGIGEPVFDKLHADLGKAMLSINAVKGFELGSGFAGAKMRGSQHNDAFVKKDGKTRTSSNNSGGILGGISNGEEILFRVAFKPVATIMQDQQSLDKSGNEVTVKGKGRHDPCVVPRAVPIVEAMANLVIADHLLRARSSKI